MLPIISVTRSGGDRLSSDDYETGCYQGCQFEEVLECWSKLVATHTVYSCCGVSGRRGEIIGLEEHAMTSLIQKAVGMKYISCVTSSIQLKCVKFGVYRNGPDFFLITS